MNFKKVHKILIMLLGLVISIVWIYPFFIVLFGSFKNRSEIFSNPLSIPMEPTLENYPTAFENMNFTQAFLNSVIITVISE